jgi:hypothetical protein
MDAESADWLVGLRVDSHSSPPFVGLGGYSVSQSIQGCSSGQ